MDVHPNKGLGWGLQLPQRRWKGTCEPHKKGFVPVSAGVVNSREEGDILSLSSDYLWVLSGRPTQIRDFLCVAVRLLRGMLAS